MPISSPLPTPPTAPTSSDAATFRSRSDAFVAWIVTFVTWMISFVTQANALEENVNAKEASAIASADIAVGAANYQGDWVAGSYSKGQSVSKDGLRYLSKINLNSDTPPSANWLNIGTAASTSFNNTVSGLTATQVEEAINELQAEKATLDSPAFTNNPTVPTQAAGDNSTRIINSLWAKLGLAYSLGANGYIKFPDWMGGVIVQWGSLTVAGSHGGYYVATLPIAFPNNNWQVIQTYGNYTVSAVVTGIEMLQTAKTLSNFTVQYGSVNGAAYTVTTNYIAFGN